ncbi:hypothetical protein LMG23992_03310 [Cupriavidus laharis]|uniref:Pilus assembly protein PilX n=1 Tax=Cupriavidus laharis TaxID=151654 RepID=A0ABM8X974_9BURK|nr:PilX N-terminal domain-containing pilus assembly protein [Cupriavidus laharis]CAG9176556.1 hypothetical protein LMG23992_03310 [Cupriavidus laharis]
MSKIRPQSRRGRRTAGGFVLVVGMLFLVIMTLFAVAMFRSVGVQESIAGNTRDKQRAFEAAHNAMKYGERWLGLGKGGTGTDCEASVTTATAPNGIQVCRAALARPMALPWATRADYRPPTMTVAAGGGMAGADINYQRQPGLYVQYLGATPDQRFQLYRVSAAGFGGNEDTAAVLQSTVEVGDGITDHGSL